MTRQEEAQVIERVLSGDINAYEQLVTQYEKSVYNLALRMTDNPEDAADMAQEAFIKAYNSLSSFRGDSKFSVWLYRIVSNVCLDFLRKQSRRPSVSLSVEDDDGEDVQLDVPDDSMSPELQLERKLTRESVREGLKQLPEDYRQILLLRELQGLSYDEIAETLEIGVGTVKSRIFRAREKLCAFLLKGGNIPDLVSSSNKRGGGSHDRM
ncbi:MAG: sigma-70 family RNA polymerase sigma factor [Oscillospiraceae bacterium]|nr:sigma-70 family RNA polymerase sigma factor [Oscillospiraceae bacterium]